MLASKVRENESPLLGGELSRLADFFLFLAIIYVENRSCEKTEPTDGGTNTLIELRFASKNNQLMIGSDGYSYNQFGLFTWTHGKGRQLTSLGVGLFFK